MGEEGQGLHARRSLTNELAMVTLDKVILHAVAFAAHVCILKVLNVVQSRKVWGGSSSVSGKTMMVTAGNV